MIEKMKFKKPFGTEILGGWGILKCECAKNYSFQKFWRGRGGIKAIWRIPDLTVFY